MITGILHSIILVVLFIAFVQDWKFRAISWTVFPLLFGATVTLFFINEQPWQILCLNLLFIALVFTTLFFYVAIKRKKFVNLFRTDLGVGDVLFLIGVAPLFWMQNFILFFITGMFFAAIFQLLVNRWKPSPTIPLAGYLSLYLIVLGGVSYLLNIDLFYQPILQ
jgi:hypothetical protein